MQSTSISEADGIEQATERQPIQLSRWSEVSLTLCLALLTAGIALLPEAATLLQFDRRVAANGFWWPILSSHFVHWNHEHLFWDLSVFVVLGAICECRDRWRYVVTLFAAGLLIPLSVWALIPEMETYRGLSGLDTALFALLAVSTVQEQWRERRWVWVLAIGGLLAALVGKIGFEFLTGGTLFVDAGAANFQPVPLAHVIGALVGSIAASSHFGKMRIG